MKIFQLIDWLTKLFKLNNRSKIILLILLPLPIFSQNNAAFWLGKRASADTEIVTDQLALHWDFSTYTSGNVIDLSGNGYNGTVSSATFTNSPPYYFNFDGVNDVITDGSSVSTGLVSISGCVWFYPVSTTNNFRLFNKYTPSATNGYLLWYSGSTSKIRFDGRNSSAAYLFVESTATVSINQWHFTCGVKSGNTWSIYINGVLDNSATLGDATTTFTNNTFKVGAIPEFSLYGQGRIGQVMIYDKALTSTEVLQNFNATKSRFGL